MDKLIQTQTEKKTRWLIRIINTDQQHQAKYQYLVSNVYFKSRLLMSFRGRLFFGGEKQSSVITEIRANKPSKEGQDDQSPPSTLKNLQHTNHCYFS